MQVFEQAAKETGVRYEPPKWKVGMTKKQAIASINDRRITLQYTGGGAICRPMHMDMHQKRRRKPSKSQKFLGMHVRCVALRCYGGRVAAMHVLGGISQGLWFAIWN